MLGPDTLELDEGTDALPVDAFAPEVEDRPAGARRWLRWAVFRQLLRYGAVSLVATTISQIVLASLVATRTTGAATANVIATLAGVIPSFELNRHWVWGKTGRRSLRHEVVPFVLLSFAGLVLSTAAVAGMSSFADAHAFSTTWRTLSVQAANLTAFGLVWIVQFVLLDRVLFRDGRHRVTALSTS